MTSILKVDELQDTSGNLIIKEDSNTITIGASGDTITIPSGATITNSGTATGFGGITMADQWRLSANFQHSGSGETTINSNWERTDTYDFSNLGSGMTESSGIFTFPSTGYYLIMFNGYIDDCSTTIYSGIRLRLTNDNSTYNVAEQCYTNLPNTNSHANNQIMYIADITNISTHKVRFDIHAGANTRYSGSTNFNNTSAKFIRLADT